MQLTCNGRSRRSRASIALAQRPGLLSTNAMLLSGRDLRRIREHHQRLAVVGDRRLVDDDAREVRHRRQVVHHVEQNLFEDRAQTARARLSRKGLSGNRAQCKLADLELDAFHPEHLVVLLDQRVLRLDQNLDQRRFVELVERRNDRQPSHELGNEAELDQVLGLGAAQKDRHAAAIVGRRDFGTEADTGFRRSLTDDLLETVECAAAHEQDVRRVDLDEFLVRMLAAALRRNAGDRAFDQLEQSLLDALTRYVARDRWVIALARNLVDLVDVDDATLRFLDVVIALLQKLLDDVLDVFADIPSFGQRRRIGNHEWNVEQPCERLGEQRLARSSWADQKDVRFRELDVIVLRARFEPLVMIVDGDGKNFFRRLLPDDVLVEDLADLVRRWQLAAIRACRLAARAFLANDVVAKLDAFIADEHRRAGDQLAHLVLALAAK